MNRRARERRGTDTLPAGLGRAGVTPGVLPREEDRGVGSEGRRTSLGGQGGALAPTTRSEEDAPGFPPLRLGREDTARAGLREGGARIRAAMGDEGSADEARGQRRRRT